MKKKAKRGNRKVGNRMAGTWSSQVTNGGQYVHRLVEKLDITPEMRANAAARYPQLVSEIDRCIASVADAVGRLPPASLLQRAWWERYMGQAGIEVEADIKQEHAIAARMVDYIQSLVASVPRAENQLSEVSDVDWAALKKDVASLYRLLGAEYLISATAHRQAGDDPISMEMEALKARAQLQWCHVRGDHYPSHQIEALSDLLLNQSELIEAAYGVTAAQLMEALTKLRHAHTYGAVEAKEAMYGAHAAFKAEVERMETSGDVEIKGSIPRGMLAEVMARLGQDEVMKEAGEKLLGLALFDVEQITNLPKSFLEDFSWSPGEDQDFFAEGEFKGWPLRIQPIFRRPFIKIDGRYLCFDLQCLFDNFYRQIEKRIFLRSEPEKQRWIANRKDNSERVPVEHLERLLPGAKVLREVYYPVVTEQGKRNFAEADCVLIYDDHLFAIEVKAGAFTYTSPANDLEAYVNSLKALVGAPALQGERFLDYLESADVVDIYDAKRRVIGSLRKADYRVKTICAVTVDPFSDIAAQAQHLGPVGVGLARRPVWSVSIADLMVYRDVFSEPLEFLHFVEQRMRAANSSALHLNDELDHLGLYLKHIQYAKFAEDVSQKSARVEFTGYRSSIDRFYVAKMTAPEVSPEPLLTLPPRIHEFVSFLTKQQQPGRSLKASCLLNLSHTERETLNEWIESELALAVPRGHCVPFQFTSDCRVSVVVGIRGRVAVSHADAIAHCRAFMVVAGEDERTLIELTYDDTALVDLSITQVTLQGLSHAELEVVHEHANKLKEQRIRKSVAMSGKPGRNERCPCGSGKKHKRCCLK